MKKLEDYIYIDSLSELIENNKNDIQSIKKDVDELNNTNKVIIKENKRLKIVISILIFIMIICLCTLGFFICAL